VVGDGAAQGQQGKLALRDLQALLLGLAGAQAGGRDLRIGEHHRWNDLAVHLSGAARDHFGHDLGLTRGLVGELRLPTTSPMA